MEYKVVKIMALVLMAGVLLGDSSFEDSQIGRGNGRLLSKTPAEQRIVVLSISATREFPSKVLIVGTGSAIVNDGSAFYFWNSSTPPRIEIEVSLYGSSLSVIQALKSAITSEIPKGKAVYLVGKGSFRALEESQIPPPGIFELDSLSQCELVSRNTIK